MILRVLLGIGAVLWVAASLTGVPEVFYYGISAVLGLLGAAIGLANWYILIRTWWTKKWESLIPIFGFMFICIAGILSECGVLKLLAVVLDPWPLYMLIGLLVLPLRLLWKWLKKRGSCGGVAAE